jgi:hypothetical protein
MSGGKAADPAPPRAGGKAESTGSVSAARGEQPLAIAGGELDAIRVGSEPKGVRRDRADAKLETVARRALHERIADERTRDQLADRGIRRDDNEQHPARDEKALRTAGAQQNSTRRR